MTCHLHVASCNDHNYTCKHICKRHRLHPHGCIFCWCLWERIGAKVLRKGMRTTFIWASSSFIKMSPCQNLSTLLGGRFMGAFRFLAKGTQAVTFACPARGYTASRWPSGLNWAWEEAYGREGVEWLWLQDCGYWCELLSLNLVRKGLCINPMWQVRKLRFRAGWTLLLRPSI